MNRKDLEFHQEFVKPRYGKYHVLKKFAKALPDHVAMIKLRLLIENEEWEQLLEWDPDPNDYLFADDFRMVYLASSVLRKYNGMNVSHDRKEVALQKWWSAEKACQETNERFRRRVEGDLFHPSVERILRHACGLISKTLGTPPSLEYIASLGSFGPGVDLSSRGQTAPFKKLSDEGQLTVGCLRLLVKSGALNWPVFEMMKTSRLMPAFELVRHNRVTFVPKNSKTDRAIAIEPRWNIFFQKAYGKLIRRKLKRVGIDLDSQKKNQALARDLNFATIDLSSASDTMSWGLVMDLLPFDWFTALDALRCESSLVNDEFVELNKFSSMGNGFTFELESLIFWALSKATCHFILGRETTFDLTVFGDDIIVPVSCYEKLCEVLSVCGFSVNKQKSFGTGLFRESCGKHYFDGFNVTPFYLKEDPSSVEQIVRFVNQVSNFAETASDSNFRDRRFLDLHRRLVSLVPQRLRYFGPAEGSGGTEAISFMYNGQPLPTKMGSQVFHSCIFAAIDQCCPPRHPNRNWDCWLLTIPVFMPNKYTAFSLPFLYEKLLSPSSDGQNFVERGRGRWKLRRVMVHSYCEPGAWT